MNYTTAHYAGNGSVATVQLHQLMEKQQQIEIGQRIKQLRDNGPHTNRSIADHVGVTPDGVKHWIGGRNGITWDHARSVAELFGVTVNWIWTGEERPPTPDVMPMLSPSNGEGPADQILALVTTLGQELADLRADVQSLERRLLDKLEELDGR